MDMIEARGAHIPVIGLGTWQMQGNEAYEAVRDGLSEGYRHLDTAALYGNEVEVGRALADSGVPRDEVFLTTKVWYEDLGREQAKAAGEASLRRLGTDYVDLLLIHWPAGQDPRPSLAGMLALVEAGKVRHVGVSNFNVALMKQSLEVAPIACNQVEYHPFLSVAPVIAFARAHDIAVTAYSPLARGRVLRDPTLQAIGQVHGKTPAQITLRWLIQQEGVAAIPKASSARHRQANLEVFDFALSEDEMARIFGLARGERLIDPPIAPDWD